MDSFLLKMLPAESLYHWKMFCLLVTFGIGHHFTEQIHKTSLVRPVSGDGQLISSECFL